MAIHGKNVAHLVPSSAVRPRAKHLTPGCTFTRALDAEGATRADVARALDVSETLVTRWVREEGRSIPLHRIEQLAGPMPKLYRRLVAMLGVRDRVRPSSCLRLSAMLGAKELGEVSQATIEALADGQLDADERKRLVQEWTDLIRVGEAAVAALETEQ